jgi:putative redox protein
MQVNVKREKGLRFVGSNSRGAEVIMDPSVAADGDAIGSSPMELLLMGLGGCSSIDVVMILEKMRQPVTDCQVTIDADRAETDPKVFTDIRMHFAVAGDGLSLDRVEHAVKLSAEKYCSASLMLGKAANITHSFEVLEN